ncbi:hypothetical protein ElyMa_002477500 [Elysia marginata]|uniref:Tc1-like transposase DDE domain-containing protein n=1 Tax=Elysia marginata TaxID=1093978 RepID=A0AAV4GPP3_9GAST|nr:hypothetical protein ElyMa_002477500 [Elysia marginata]
MAPRTKVVLDSNLQHDNARAHTNRQTRDAFRQLELWTDRTKATQKRLSQCSLGPHPALIHHCDNDEEFIADVRRWCRGQSCEFFTNGVRQLVKRWKL